MFSDYKSATGHKALVDSVRDFTLKCFLKIRERQIPAEDQVEQSFRYFPADILLAKFNTGPEAGAKTKAPTALLKRRLSPLKRHFLQAVARVAGGTRPLQLLLVAAGAKNVQSTIWEPWLKQQSPLDRQAVAFFTRSAADAPNADLVALIGSLLCELGEYSAPQEIKNGAVTKKARDRYVAKHVQVRPFVRVCFEIRLVRRPVRKVELPHASDDALTYLLSNSSKTRPAHSQFWQGPLQKQDAL
jgi:hypothetical protein